MTILFLVTTLHGLLASIASLFCLYAFGVLMLPCSFFERSNFSISPFFCGAALLALIGWYAINNNIALSTVFSGIFYLMLVLAFFRRKYIAQLLLLKNNIAIVVGVYSIFYLLMAAFMPYPLLQEKLSLVTFGNNDVFNYIAHARYLMHLGDSNLANVDYITQGAYSQTPAVFYFIGLLSVFYRGDVMAAAMPTLFMGMALIGVMVMHYCRVLFQFSYGVSAMIGAIVICGPFYRYIAIQYFLSTVLSTVPVLSLLVDTATFDWQNTKQGVVRFFIMSAPYWLLLFLLYSVLFMGGILLQISLIFCLLCVSVSWKKILPIFMFWLFCAGVCLIVTLLFAFPHAQEVLITLSHYASAQGQGWGMHWISSMAILGIPGKIDVRTFWLCILWGSVFFIIVFAVFAVRWKKPEMKAAKILFFFAMMAVIVYDLLFYWMGPSDYRPWKMASYYALPLSGALWAGFFYVLSLRYSWRDLNKVIAGLAIGLIVYNGFFARYKEQPFDTFSTHYQSLAKLDNMPFSKLWIQMATYSSTFLPLYFIPHKTLYLLSDSYYPKSTLDPSKVSRDWPLFIETKDACVSIFPRDVQKIDDLGCLYFKYPF